MAVVVALAVVFLGGLQWYRAFGGNVANDTRRGKGNSCDLKGRAPGGTDKINITLRARNTGEHDWERERRRKKKRTRKNMLPPSALPQ